MIRRKPLLQPTLPKTVQENADSLPPSKTQSVANQPQTIDDLLRAFSDTAYSAEEENHSWESWNYSRISAF